MSKYPGQVTRIGDWEYWFGVKKGKRIYLAARYNSLNTWEFSSLREVKLFIKLWESSPH